jgi:hypothetical protein
MRRKTDFYTLEDKAKGMLGQAYEAHAKLFKEDKQREAAMKSKQEQEKVIRAEHAEKKKKEAEAKSS